MSDSMLPFDPNELILTALRAYQAESERWEALTESDDSDTPKGTDVRTVVKEIAGKYNAPVEISEYRTQLSDMVATVLDSEDTEALCWLSGVFSTAAAAINEAAKYGVKSSRPETTDTDSDLVETYEAMKIARDTVNMGLTALGMIGQRPRPYNVTSEGKERKRTTGTVTVDGTDLKVRIANDQSLTLNVRLPNDPSESGKTVGRPVQTSRLRFTINGEPFTPRSGVATVHLAHEINRLGGNVPVTTDEFIAHCNAVSGGDFFKAPWDAQFGNVSVNCRKAE